MTMSGSETIIAIVVPLMELPEDSLWGNSVPGGNCVPPHVSDAFGRHVTLPTAPISWIAACPVSQVDTVEQVNQSPSATRFEIELLHPSVGMNPEGNVAP